MWVVLPATPPSFRRIHLPMLLTGQEAQVSSGPQTSCICLQLTSTLPLLSDRSARPLFSYIEARSSDILRWQ